MQLSLHGRGPQGFDRELGGVERRWLDEEAWIDLRPGWVQGHDGLCRRLLEGLPWEAHRRRMYERYVDVPRLMAGCPPLGRFPMVEAMAAALGSRYGVTFGAIAFAYYRDGRDSVAFHRDKVLRDQVEAHVAVVVLGNPRPFLLRPFGGGPSLVLTPGWGDLLVMGGSCQRTWEHGVPKVRHAGPRVCIMYRDGAT